MTAFGLAAATLYAQTSSTTPSPTAPTTEEKAVAPAPQEAVPASEATPAPAPATEETPIKAKREPPKALDQKGKIEAIDTAAGTFTVEGKTFVLSKSKKGKVTGKVFVDGVPMSLSDLKKDDLVAVTYYANSDGTNKATRVYKGCKGRLKAKTEKSKTEKCD